MELPIGFSMAIMQNPDLMYYFSTLPEAKQQELITQAHGMNSKAEMQDFFAHLGKK